MKAIEVRGAVPGDVEAIAGFQQRMARETEGKELDGPTVRAGVGGVLADPARGRYLVAEVGGRVAGALLLTTEWSDWRNGVYWWIQSVYVEPEARGRGVFTALYRAVEREAEAAPDVRGLRLYVERENLRAQATYRRLGMSETAYRLFEAARPPAK